MSNSPFFIIGAQRCGTSTLRSMLDSHRDIEMMKPFSPEPKFFLDENADAAGFLARFKTGKPIRGEKSTSYLEHPEAAPRIKHHFPDARIVVCLRNPIERAISNYWFSVASGSESLPILAAFDAETRRKGTHDMSRFSVSPWAYSDRSRYVEYLEPWLEHFGLQRTHIVVLERLVNSPDSTISGLLNFLNAAQVGLTPISSNEQVRSLETPPELLRKLRDELKPATARLAALLNDDFNEWQF